MKSTQKVIDALSTNLKAVKDKYVFVNAAVATLIETALSLRPLSSPKKPNVEINVLQAAALGLLKIEGTPGTLLWFQAHAKGAGGASYERRSGNTTHAGFFFSDFSIAVDAHSGDEYTRTVSDVIESSMPDRDRSTNITVQPPENGKTRNGEADPKTGSDIQSTPELIHSQNSGIEILVGEQPLETGTQPILFRPSETSLNQLNIGIVGDLGTGKTQFLKSLIFQLAKASEENRGRSPKIFIFDYKPDYSSDEFSDQINAQVLDPTQTLPLNFFALGESATHVDRVRRAHFFADMLNRIAGIGVVQRHNLYESIMDAYNRCPSGLSPVLDDIFEIYRDKVSGKADSVVAELALMTDLRVFERDTNNVCTFNDLFTKNTVINLSNLGKAGQNIVDIVVTMLLDHLYHDYMKSVHKEPFLPGEDGISRRFIDSFILIDEAHHAMARDFNVLMDLMLEGREFGVGVILSSQYLSHFKSGNHDWAEALATWAVHNVKKVRSKDFEQIGFGGNTQAMATRVPTLEPHWAYYRCANGQTEGLLMKGQPFYSLPRQE